MMESFCKNNYTTNVLKYVLKNVLSNLCADALTFYIYESLPCIFHMNNKQKCVELANGMSLCLLRVIEINKEEKG